MDDIAARLSQKLVNKGHFVLAKSKELRLRFAGKIILNELRRKKFTTIIREEKCN
jgi:hypothetical protein